MSRKEAQTAINFDLPKPELKPAAGLAEPLVWIQSLRLWHDFADNDSTHGRTIMFRRGLNIISSPVGSVANKKSSGHAAGKTLLCRQIRYCLGEDTFADPEDTASIRALFPRGGVSAMIRLCGETWMVRREFAPRGDDRAIRGERLEDLDDDACRGSFEDFRKTINDVALKEPNRGFLTALKDVDVPWQYVLAWLTRDQECRLDGLTHWRHPESSSHSPARNVSAETRMNLMRIVFGLYSKQSDNTRKQAAAASKAARDAESEARKINERFISLRKGLAAALQDTDSGIWPPSQEILQDEQSAQEAHFRKLERLIDQQVLSTTVLKATDAQKSDEQALEIAKSELAEVEQQIVAQSDAVKLSTEHLELVSNESAECWSEVRRSKHLTCPYDDTPLDVEKAKFVCPLPRFPDSDKAKRIALESETHRKTIADELTSRQSELARLHGHRAGLSTRITNLERAINIHQLAIIRTTQESQAAWAAKVTLRNFRASVKELEEARAAEKQLKEAEKSALEQKSQQLSILSTVELTKWFDVWVKQIVAEEARGEILIDGNGLHPNIYWRGRRRSVALNSLRIVLFDLTAMLCAVEGTAAIPAFLLHDSPREGDLDPWTYARLFEAALAFGPDEDTAPFQYIVTTTTEPPEGEVRKRIRLELSALSNETRFFRVDL